MGLANSNTASSKHGHKSAELIESSSPEGGGGSCPLSYARYTALPEFEIMMSLDLQDELK